MFGIEQQNKMEEKPLEIRWKAQEKMEITPACLRESSEMEVARRS